MRSGDLADKPLKPGSRKQLDWVGSLMWPITEGEPLCRAASSLGWQQAAPGSVSEGGRRCWHCGHLAAADRFFQEIGGNFQAIYFPANAFQTAEQGNVVGSDFETGWTGE